MNNFWKTFLAALLGTLAALILNVVLFFVLIGAVASSFSAQSAAPVVPQNAILKIDLSKPIAERTTDGASSLSLAALYSGMPESSIGVRDVVLSLREAADDPSIKMVLLTNGFSTNSGFAALEELRRALDELHESGKPIVSYGVNYSLGGYYISSISDKIYIHNDGSAMFVGLGTNMMFFKDLLDKLGINVQLVRHGKFKAAAEQFILNDISKENRRQNEEMLNSIWGNWAEAICESRGIERKTLDDAIDNLNIGDAESMVENRLADTTLSGIEMEQKLVELTGVSNSRQLKFISLADYNKARRSAVSKSPDKVAVLYAGGEITMNGGEGIAAARIIPEIKKISRDSTIKAVVLRVNSPGGDAQAAEVIREAIQEMRGNKPVISSYGEYAASGGYWISAQSDMIVSEANTLTGSIGVFSLAFNAGKGLKQHLHINSVSLGTHRHSTMGRLVDPLSPEEIAFQQKFVESIYTKFTSIVADGRKMSVERVDSIGQGRVWTGLQALENNLVDTIGTLDDAIRLAAQAAGLDSEDGKGFKVVEYPAVKSSMEVLLGRLGQPTTDGSDELNNTASVNGQGILGISRTCGRFENLGLALGTLSPEQAVKLLFPDLYEAGTYKVYALMPCLYRFKY